MTIPYNVSFYSMLSYIKYNFIPLDNDVKKSVYITDNSIILDKTDFKVLVRGLTEVLTELFPKLQALLKYLKDMSKVCTVLEIPIIGCDVYLQVYKLDKVI